MIKFGVKFKDIIIFQENFNAYGNKVLVRSRAFFIFKNDINEYIPFLRRNGKDVNFKHSIIKYSNDIYCISLEEI